jgi:large subunit ribosomal protein L25
MSDVLTVSAELRERAGKGASRELRKQGRVPAVIYGNNKDPISIHLEEKLIIKYLNTGTFFDSEILVEVNGESIRTLPKDLQFHPVNDRPLHIDLFRIG